MKMIRQILSDPKLEHIGQGVKEGERNDAAIYLADHFLHYLSMNPDQALLALQRWNEKNQPPLSADELRRVLQSSINNGAYWTKKLVVDVPGKYMGKLSRKKLLKILNKTITHDDATKLATFLSMVSTYGKDLPLNVIFKSDTATGKSHIALECAKYFPAADRIVYTKCSPNAFYHEYGIKGADGANHIDLDRKILVFKDQPHDLLLDNLKPLMSHDALENKAAIADKDGKGSIRTKKIMLDGYPCFVFCTARLATTEEIANRAFLLSPSESQDKLAASIEMLALKEGNPIEYNRSIELDPQRKALIDHIFALRNDSRAYVIVPQMKKVQKIFRERHKTFTARAQRDFPRLIGLIKAWAYLRRNERVSIGEKIVAKGVDVKDAFAIYDELAESNELGLAPQLLDFFKQVIKPLASPGSPIDRKQIRKKYLQTYHRPLSDNKLVKHILPSLESAGLISLEPDPTDKRRILVYIEN